MNTTPAVQFAVLRAVSASPVVDVAELAQTCQTEPHDIRHAIGLLVHHGALEHAPDSAPERGAEQRLLLTHAGRWYLEKHSGSPLDADSSAAASVQWNVQSAVLQALLDSPVLDVQQIADACRADLRDVFRAIEVLTRGGVIESAPDALRQSGTVPLLFTDAGLLSLRGERPWPTS